MAISRKRKFVFFPLTESVSPSGVKRRPSSRDIASLLRLGSKGPWSFPLLPPAKCCRFNSVPLGLASSAQVSPSSPSSLEPFAVQTLWCLSLPASFIAVGFDPVSLLFIYSTTVTMALQHPRQFKRSTTSAMQMTDPFFEQPIPVPPAIFMTTSKVVNLIQASEFAYDVAVVDCNKAVFQPTSRQIPDTKQKQVSA
ncbi:hypothetical protein LINGRAHAP2_LOCUS11045 [Linum grandiflorum]